MKKLRRGRTPQDAEDLREKVTGGWPGTLGGQTVAGRLPFASRAKAPPRPLLSVDIAPYAMALPRQGTSNSAEIVLIESS
jgi:hypothetical protein